MNCLLFIDTCDTIRVGGTCYKYELVQVFLPWEDAEQYCIDTHGGHLLAFPNAQVFDYIVTLLSGRSGKNIETFLSTI